MRKGLKSNRLLEVFLKFNTVNEANEKEIACNLRDKLRKFKRMSNVNDFFKYVFETKKTPRSVVVFKPNLRETELRASK